MPLGCPWSTRRPPQAGHGGRCSQSWNDGPNSSETRSSCRTIVEPQPSQRPNTRHPPLSMPATVGTPSRHCSRVTRSGRFPDQDIRGGAFRARARQRRRRPLHTLQRFGRAECLGLLDHLHPLWRGGAIRAAPREGAKGLARVADAEHLQRVIFRSPDRLALAAEQPDLEASAAVRGRDMGCFVSADRRGW